LPPVAAAVVLGRAEALWVSGLRVSSREEVDLDYTGVIAVKVRTWGVLLQLHVAEGTAGLRD
ncbi:MAG: hypothetical protein U5K56_00065, partial [Halioglobus sp.]|nr:hypothetical protein [Halioglobus sp.]